MPREFKIFLNLVKIVMYLFIYLHIVACSLFFVFLKNAPPMFILQDDGSYASLNKDVNFRLEDNPDFIDTKNRDEVIFGYPHTFEE